MNNKLGQEPAFSNPGYYPDDPNDRMEPRERIGLSNEAQKGISKRFYAACAAMQGMLSNMDFQKASAMTAQSNNIPADEWLIKIAYNLADELLKQENI